MQSKKSFKLEEASIYVGLDQKVILEFIQNEWITLADHAVAETQTLDEEDIARLRLIIQLRDSFGVNDEGIPIILHLLDQLHHLHYQLHRKDF